MSPLQKMVFLRGTDGAGRYVSTWDLDELRPTGTGTTVVLKSGREIKATQTTEDIAGRWFEALAQQAADC